MNVSIFRSAPVIPAKELHPLHSWPRLVFRFVSGRPLDGYRHSDASWSRGGQALLSGGGGSPGWWESLPLRTRAVLRLSLVAVPVVELFAAVLLPLFWWQLLNLAVFLLGVERVWSKSVRWFGTRRHRLGVVEPLARSLAGPLGLEGTSAGEWVDVPPGFLAGDVSAVARILLPDSVAVEPSTQRQVEAAVRLKLSAPDAVFTWKLSGARPCVEARRRERPPAKVPFATARPLVEAAKESAPLLGLGRGGKPIAVDLDTESPHIAVSMGTGAGKSSMVRGALAQLMHNGAQVVVVDMKRTSHMWLRDLPGLVSYARTPAEAHAALVAAAEAMHARNLAFESDPDADLGPRLVVVVEEINMLAGRLVRYWQETRTTGDPKGSPAVEALGELLFAGRAVRVHVIAVGQSLTVRALGNDPALRENFGVKILGRYSGQMWKMLAGPSIPMPAPTRHEGRVQIVQDGAAIETQAVWWTELEAREWARTGAAAASLTVEVAADAATAEPVAETAPESPSGLRLVPDLVCEEPVVVPVSLSAACDIEGVLGGAGVSLAAARKARQRDDSFPAPVDRRGSELLYAPDELAAWALSRRTAGGAA